MENGSAVNSYIPPLALIIKHGWRWQVNMPLGLQWKAAQQVRVDPLCKSRPATAGLAMLSRAAIPLC